MFFGYGDGEFGDFRNPSAGSFSVQMLPDQRETSSAVEQAPHCMLFAMFIDSFEEPRPERKSDAVAKQLIPFGVGSLLEFALGVDIIPDVAPSIRESLAAFRLEVEEGLVS